MFYKQRQTQQNVLAKLPRAEKLSRSCENLNRTASFHMFLWHLMFNRSSREMNTVFFVRIWGRLEGHADLPTITMEPQTLTRIICLLPCWVSHGLTFHGRTISSNCPITIGCHSSLPLLLPLSDYLLSHVEPNFLTLKFSGPSIVEVDSTPLAQATNTMVKTSLLSISQAGKSTHQHNNIFFFD
jgi:hypothetical protein